MPPRTKEHVVRLWCLCMLLLLHLEACHNPAAPCRRLQSAPSDTCPLGLCCAVLCRLEGARVAASRSSPMWETLELAARYADPAGLELLVPELCTLVRRGPTHCHRGPDLPFFVSPCATSGRALPYHVLLYHVLPYHVLLCRALRCRAVLCFAVLCCAALCCVCVRHLL